MEKRKLGIFSIPKLTFGSNIFGWTVDKKTSFSLLDKLLENGLNFIDTADIYSTWAPGNKGGESENIIGSWLKLNGRRDKIIIATKVGMQFSENKKGLSRNYILQAIEDSLKRLQTDYIDLYQSHKDDEITDIDETLGAYDSLIKAGKVRMIGASNFSAERLKESVLVSKNKNLAPYQCLQPHYNLFDRQDFETKLEQFCLENNFGVITYFSLASGFLTGKYRSEKDFTKSIRGGSMHKFLNKRGHNILKALDVVSERHQANPSQVSLAWLMARPSVTAPIASATTLAQIDELVKATHLKLNTEDIIYLNEASAY